MNILRFFLPGTDPGSGAFISIDLVSYEYTINSYSYGINCARWGCAGTIVSVLTGIQAFLRKVMGVVETPVRDFVTWLSVQARLEERQEAMLLQVLIPSL